MKIAFLPVLGAVLGAVAAAPAGAQGYAVIAANLLGNQVVGEGAEGAGDDAGGDFNGEIDFAQNRICYYFEAYGIDGADAAHIHQGVQGESGPAVMTLAVPSEDPDEACTEADAALLRAIADNPAGYYADVHTAAHPAGALRGQLHD